MDVGRYDAQEIQKALDQMERRKEYQKRYYQTCGGRLAQRRSQVRSILSRSGTFTAEEITAIVSRIRLPEVDGDRAGGDAKGGGKH